MEAVAYAGHLLVGDDIAVAINRHHRVVKCAPARLLGVWPLERAESG